MSQENVEIVRRGYERFNEGDIRASSNSVIRSLNFAIFRSFRVPGCSLATTRCAAGGRSFMTHSTTCDFDADEFIDAGDRVLVTTTGRGRSRSSGALAEI